MTNYAKFGVFGRNIFVVYIEFTIAFYNCSGLTSVTIPESVSIGNGGSLDLNSDGVLDIDDAVLLFRHSILPDLYPLAG